MAQRRGADPHEEEVADDYDFFSPGVEKKSNSSLPVNRGGGFGNLFGNAVKLFENVGDVVTNIVAPLPDDSFEEGLNDDGQDYIEYNERLRSNSQELDEYKEGTYSESDDNISTISKESIDLVQSMPYDNIQRITHHQGHDQGQNSNHNNNPTSLSLSAPAYDPRFLSNMTDDSGDNSVRSTTHSHSHSESLSSVALDTPPASPTVSEQHKTHGENTIPTIHTPVSMHPAPSLSMNATPVDISTAANTPIDMYKAVKSELSTVQKKFDTARDDYDNQLREKNELIVELTEKVNSSSESADLLSQTAELNRLKRALQDSEDMFKQSEEETWQAKAYSSELLYALEDEQKKLEQTIEAKQQLSIKYETCKDENMSLSRKIKELETLSEEQAKTIERLKATNVTEKSIIAATANALDAIEHTSDSNVEKSADDAVEKKAYDDDTSTMPSSSTNDEEWKSKLDKLEKTLQQVKDECIALTERNQILSDELTIERNDVEDARKTNERSNRQIEALETEKEQLNVMLSQYLESIKSKKESLSNITAERDELRDKVASLSNAWSRDSQQLSKYSSQLASDNHEKNQMSIEMYNLQSTLESVENDLQMKLEIIADLEKNNYDLTVLSDTLQSDNLLLKQDLDQRKIEINNLHRAMDFVNSEKQQLEKDMGKQQHSLIEDTKKAHEEHLATTQSQWQQIIRDKEEEILLANQRVEDEMLLRRKAQMELNTEKKTMQKSLEKAVNQMTNTHDSVDRALVANLIVSYFKQKRSKEILTLISKILDFSQEQRIAVGLEAPNVSLMNTLLKFVPQADTQASIEVCTIIYLYHDFSSSRFIMLTLSLLLILPIHYSDWLMTNIGTARRELGRVVGLLSRRQQ